MKDTTQRVYSPVSLTLFSHRKAPVSSEGRGKLSKKKGRRERSCTQVFMCLMPHCPITNAAATVMCARTTQPSAGQGNIFRSAVLF